LSPQSRKDDIVFVVALSLQRCFSNLHEQLCYTTARQSNDQPATALSVVENEHNLHSVQKSHIVTG